MKRLIFTILGVLFFCGLSAQEIPQKISYQGKLIEKDEPVTGTKSISFTIGTWTETQNITVTNGLYSVQLGKINPIPTSIFTNNASVSLLISVEGINLSPQTEILSVAYAFKAEKAADTDKIAGNPVSGTPSTNQILKWNGSQWTPADNTDNQTLSISGSDLTISEGNTVSLPSKGLTLPIRENTNYNNNDIIIDRQSSSGNILDLRMTNTTNSDEVISASSNGSGDVIFGKSTGSGNAIVGSTSGSGDAIHGVVYGSGDAGHFYINIESNNGRAVYARTKGTGEAGYFFIDNTNSDEDVIYAKTTGTGRAAYFSGNVRIVGSLTKSSGTFIIDHPLDPENKYLYHSFVESPDMMNVYNGNIILDNNGEAIITLPDYFEALNMKFRYQLTCIGSFAPVYISNKISNNRFKIAGGTNGMEVSWQVTGIRQDPYAKENRIQVEVEKSKKEKGYYLHHKEYNQPYEKSIESLHDLDSNIK